MSKRKDNLSSIFLLPLIGMSKKHRDLLHIYNIVNTYMYCDELSYPKMNVLYLLFKPKKLTEDFNNFIEEIKTNVNFIESVNLSNNFLILVYKIPDIYKKDYLLFKEGKYSKLSAKYKENFELQKPKLNTYGKYERDRNGSVIMQPTNFYHVFNRTQILKEHYMDRFGVDEHQLPDELHEKVDENKELLSLNNITNTINHNHHGLQVS